MIDENDFVTIDFVEVLKMRCTECDCLIVEGFTQCEVCSKNMKPMPPLKRANFLLGFALGLIGQVEDHLSELGKKEYKWFRDSVHGHVYHDAPLNLSALPDKTETINPKGEENDAQQD